MKVLVLTDLQKKKQYLGLFFQRKGCIIRLHRSWELEVIDSLVICVIHWARPYQTPTTRTKIPNSQNDPYNQGFPCSHNQGCKYLII